MVNLYHITDGNPGALTFLIQAYKDDMFGAERAFQRMQDNDIIGSKLYMLWNDCCDRNTKKALSIMLNNDIQDIVEHINYENGRGIPYNIDIKNTEIKIGDEVLCVSPEYFGVKGTVIKQYCPTACEEQTLIKCYDGREFHAPTKEFRKKKPYIY